LGSVAKVKGTLTFDGGVDYILWKIKHQSGVTIEANPFLRRHPILAMLVLSCRLYRLGNSLKILRFSGMIDTVKISQIDKASLSY
jgi:hypothetical protein